MKAVYLLEALGEAGEPWLAQAQRKKRSLWAQLLAAAACLLLVLIRPGNQDKFVEPIHLLIWEGRYYEIVDQSDRLELPARIKEDRVGAAIGSGRLESGGEELELFQYLPERGEPCEALFLVRFQDRWQYAVFCNYIDGMLPTAGQLLKIYGVSGPEDLVENGDWAARLLQSEPWDFERYYKSVYGGLTEDQMEKKSSALAKTHQSIRLVTASGHVFWIGWQPETGFVNWALNYYKIG